MTKEQQSKIEQGTHVIVPKWEQYLRYFSVIAVISSIFYIGAWTSDSESRMFDSTKQKSEVILHSTSTEVHRTVLVNQELFITRKEYDITLKNIEKSLDEIKRKLD